MTELARLQQIVIAQQNELKRLRQLLVTIARLANGLQRTTTLDVDRKQLQTGERMED